MKKIAAWFAAHASLTLAISGVLVFFGVVAACPASGVWATLPVSFCLFAAACLLRRGVVFPVALSAALALGYGFGMTVAAPFAFAGETALLALAAWGLAACLRVLVSRRKTVLLIPVLVLAAVGIVLPLLVYGTPTSYLAARGEARDYLTRRYPDQSFTRIDGYRDPVKGVWHCDCSYLYEGNSLSSVVLFGADVTDGFLADRMAYSLEPRRTAFIEALRNGEENVLVEPDGYSDALTKRDVIPGSYGVYDLALEGEMRFSVTFRREKTRKRDFALAIRDAMVLLRDADLRYNQIRFVALSAGSPVYECTVTPDTPAEDLIDMITRI